MVEHFSIDAASQIIVSLLGSDNFILIVMIFAFWILFYGIFTLALKKAPFVGGDESHLKLAKIISGTLSAIIVLSSLIMTPRGGMIEYAKEIASRFNTLFAIILSIVVFFLFKGLLSTEDKKFQYYGGFWGLTLALFLFGSLAPENGLARYARSFGVLGFIILISSAVVYFIYHFEAFGTGKRGSSGGGDKSWEKELDEIIDMDDEKEQVKKFSKIVEKYKDKYREKFDNSVEIYEELKSGINSQIRSLERFLTKVRRQSRQTVRKGYDIYQQEGESRTEDEEEAEKQLLGFSKLKSRVEQLGRMLQNLRKRVEALDKYAGNAKSFKKKAPGKMEEIDNKLNIVESLSSKLVTEYDTLVGDIEHNLGDDVVDVDYQTIEGGRE